MKIFLLIGQSNMAGRGHIDDVPKLGHPDLFMFRDEAWMPAVEPLHTDKPRAAGIGLGMSFARALVDAPGLAPIGLVPCAVGGTPLRRWMPGADLYESAIATARAALAHGELSGILWHQGEGDSGEHGLASSYGERFGRMIRRLRAELNADEAPVLAGELGSFLSEREGSGFYTLVNRQLHELEATLPRYACVSADGLEDKGDLLHFNARSLREFGIRYAQRFSELRDATS